MNPCKYCESIHDNCPSCGDICSNCPKPKDCKNRFHRFTHQKRKLGKLGEPRKPRKLRKINLHRCIASLRLCSFCGKLISLFF